MVLNVVRRLAVRSAAILLVLVCHWVLLANPAQATLLNIVPGKVPDVYSGWIAVNYDASSLTGHFTAAGSCETFDLTGEAPIDYWSNSYTPNLFQIDMYVNKGSGAPLSGTLTISGGFDGIGNGTLLSGSISQFGFPDPGNGDNLEFVFDVNGGILNTNTPSYFPSQALVLLHTTGFAGTFATDFANDGYSGNSDTKAIPEPSSVTLLLAFAAIGMTTGLYRRLRRVQPAMGLENLSLGN